MLKFIGDFNHELVRCDFDYHNGGSERRYRPNDYGTFYIYTEDFDGNTEREIEIYAGDEVPNEIMDKLFDLIQAGLVEKVEVDNGNNE